MEMTNTNFNNLNNSHTQNPKNTNLNFNINNSISPVNANNTIKLDHNLTREQPNNTIINNKNKTFFDVKIGNDEYLEKIKY